MVTQTYLPSNLCDSSESSDSCNSSDSSESSDSSDTWDSSDSSDGSDKKNYQKLFFYNNKKFTKNKSKKIVSRKKNFTKKFEKLKLWWNSKSHIVIKLKFQIVMKLKN